MELDPNAAIGAVQAGWAQLSALFVSYSFSVVGAIILVVVGYVIAGLVERGIRRALNSIRGFDATLSQFFSTIARYAVLALVLVMVLGQFGVQTASIIAAIGAIGLAIGLALQGTLQNIAAGIMLLVLRPFRVGEYVQVGEVAGTVEDIGLFASRLRTADGVYLLAPNSTLWNQPVLNFSRNAARRTDIKIGIGYEDDIDLAMETMMDLANAEPRILRDPEPGVFIDSLGDSAVVLTLRYWVGSPEWWNTTRDMIKRVKQAFDEKGISIPFPQVTYHNAVAPADVTEENSDIDRQPAR